MNVPNFPPDPTLSLTGEKLVDQLCDTFEREWKRGERPRIEDRISGIHGSAQEHLLRELVAVEVEMRRALGENPEPSEYESRFPGHAATIERAFVSAVAQRNAPESTVAAAGDTSERATGAGAGSGSSDWPSHIGRYEILRILGKGGFAVVYLARDPQLDRLVALKMILAGANAPPEVLDRFQIEAQSIAHLNHPNIVNIYEVGVADGLPYLALEFVEGGSLVTRDPRPPRSCAETLETLAKAIQFAHDHSIVHRDLKPANVLVTPDGVPKVSDFGLAKRLESDSGRTVSGSVFGTPSFMAPEQARGENSQVGPPADVYALGAILYDQLTGRPPFVGTNTLDTLKMVCSAEPVAPSELVAHVPRDLETIRLKCPGKEPPKRYETAAALADDVRRFLDGHPIVARPVSSFERAWRWARRSPWKAAAASLVVVVAVVASTLSYYLAEAYRGESEARQTADERRGIAERATILAQTKTAEAEAAQEVAEAARDVARQQRNNSLDVIRGVLLLVDDTMRDREDLQRVRQAIITVAVNDMNKVQKFSEEHPLRLDDRTEAAGAQRTADIWLKTGNLTAAGNEFAKAYSILSKLAEATPNDPNSVRNLAAITNLRGDIYLRTGDAVKARECYQTGLELRQKWVTLHPEPGDNQTKARWSLAQSHGLMAKVDMMLGRPAEALQHVEAGRKIYPELPDKVRNCLQARQERAALDQRAGDVLCQLNKADEAEKSYLDALALRETIVADSAGKMGDRDIGLSNVSLGDFFLRERRDPQGAWDKYCAAADVFNRLAAAEPMDLNASRDVGLIEYRLGVTLEYLAAAGKAIPNEDPKAHFAKCLDVRKKLASIDQSDAQAKIELALALARCGQVEEAARLGAELTKDNSDARVLFQVACINAVCAGACEAAQAGQYRDEAFNLLNRLIETGWSDVAAFRNDPDLDSIRPDARFSAFVKAQTDVNTES